MELTWSMFYYCTPNYTLSTFWLWLLCITKYPGYVLANQIIPEGIFAYGFRKANHTLGNIWRVGIVWPITPVCMI